MSGSADGTVAAILGELAGAAAERNGLPPSLLGGYLTALLEVARTGRRLSAAEEQECRRLGAEAAGDGVGLPALVDLYMTASARLWPHLPVLLDAARDPPRPAGELIAMGEAVWRAADTALAAVTGGHAEELAAAVRREEALRQEFLDDLLSGRSDVGSLVRRGEPLGLRLAATHVAVVAGTDRPVDAGMRLSAVVDEARARIGNRGLLVAAKDGRLVCLLSSPPADDADRGPDPAADALAELAGPVVGRLTGRPDWRVGVGRPHAGPQGVPRSYREAVEALGLGERLALPEPVARARDLLAYRVLLRDETATADLVEVVLGPLTGARGGAEPLLQTLEAYFATGGNAAETARRLHLSVRAVTYRLRRVADLTGRDAADPADHLTLLLAVTAARLLDWPGRRPPAGRAARRTTRSRFPGPGRE
ncbi:PucR family transcriptional regulator [Geodermatophilus ruber]|uniref:Transcriptional regulator, CdaR family n=1 Tax=Geodermatophilus ruber TaxID=504800 RepID=A0A1I4AV30_9ACTN|nr:helix-turn-helix domain-containing protein [Geodermatophilus ruber]SFK60274.1 transcriptional regulator, CdaR family [Geodermatophilus ruber]